jgi:hypothetical protein
MPAPLSRASRWVITQLLPAVLATLPIHGQVLETVAAVSGAIPRRQIVGGPLWQQAAGANNQPRPQVSAYFDRVALDPRYFMAPPRPRGLIARPTASRDDPVERDHPLFNKPREYL